MAVDYRDSRLADNAYSVLRAPLDAWMADQCVDSGVELLTGIRVDEVLSQEASAGEQMVYGVRANEDILTARLVIAADGVNSFCARQLGLREKPEPRQLGVGIKAVVELDEKIIEDRFGVRGEEGAAFALVGDCTNGLGGGGFLYTNRSSVSVGLVLRLDELSDSDLPAPKVFQRYLEDSYVSDFLDGGKVSEYGCHLVAEGGYDMIGRISTGGFMVIGEAAGLALNTGLTVRGMDLAAGSALVAAKVATSALLGGDCSASKLDAYRTALEQSFVGKDMKTYRKAPRFLETERLYRDYGQLAASLLLQVYDHDLQPRRPLRQVAWSSMCQSAISLRQLTRDAWQGLRSM